MPYASVVGTGLSFQSLHRFLDLGESGVRRIFHFTSASYAMRAVPLGSEFVLPSLGPCPQHIMDFDLPRAFLLKCHCFVFGAQLSWFLGSVEQAS